MLGVEKAASTAHAARVGAWEFAKFGLLLLLLIGGVKWAHDNPEAWQVVADKVMGTFMLLVPPILDGILQIVLAIIQGIVGLLPEPTT